MFRTHVQRVRPAPSSADVAGTPGSELRSSVATAHRTETPNRLRAARVEQTRHVHRRRTRDRPAQYGLDQIDLGRLSPPALSTCRTRLGPEASGTRHPPR